MAHQHLPGPSDATDSDRVGDRDALALALANLASRAGKEIMAIYQAGFDVEHKDDGSPLTRADLAADAILAEGLRALAPSIPILSEETADDVAPDALGEVFFVVDPLDGTREFVEKNGEFSINIALVERGVPTVGVVYAPARRAMWLGGRTAFAATITPGDAVDRSHLRTIQTCAEPDAPIRAVASRSHRDRKTDAFLKDLAAKDPMSIGSALKFCLVAEGSADVYPRYSDTMVWDTAAGVAVVQAAGGMVLDEADAPMRVRFGPDGWRNGGFTAWGCAKLKDKTIKKR